MRINGSANSDKIAAFQKQACLSLVSSLRDYWRNLGFVNLVDPARTELGKKVCDGLYKVLEYGVESFDEKVSSKREFTRVCDPERVSQLLVELDDPVLTGLWTLNTVQAMLDLLTHNGLHMWDRHHLLESTLDYAAKHQVSVQPADLADRGLPLSDFDEALIQKVACALGLVHVKDIQFRTRTGVIGFIPLQETSQALQLARVLNIGISVSEGTVTAIAIDRPHLIRQEQLVHHENSVEAATRRAIVMVAANILDATPECPAA